MSTEASDPIDAAIDATEPVDEPKHLIAQATFRNGDSIELKVPLGFDADEFESAVGILMQLRVKADEIRAASEPQKLVVPGAPVLVDASGRRLT